jgi:hypothetical protein
MVRCPPCPAAAPSATATTLTKRTTTVDSYERAIVDTNVVDSAPPTSGGGPHTALLHCDEHAPSMAHSLPSLTRRTYAREPHKMFIAFMFTCTSAFLNFFLLVLVHDVVPQHEVGV